MKTSLLAFILAISAAFTGRIKEEKHPALIGRWCLTSNSLNYPSIVFMKDSLCVFNSRVDTVYGFKYYIAQPYLYLVLPTGEVKLNRIIKLTKDSLAFANLLEHRAPQVYYRCEL